MTESDVPLPPPSESLPAFADTTSSTTSVTETAMAALPGLVRIGTSTLAHTAAWGAVASWRATKRVARAAVIADEMARLADDLGAITDRAVAIATNVAKSDLARGNPVGEVMTRVALPTLSRMQAIALSRGTQRLESDEDRLRRAGSNLLDRSRDVWGSESRHPAYDTILKELAPDEARILVLLMREGPQPSVDVITGGLTGRFASREIARGLTMVGLRAAVRYHDSVPQYLNNLTRLGLIWLSPEPLRDLMRYQVVEAQPDVLDAKHSAKSRVIRKAIHLTPFGVDFVRLVFTDAGEATDEFPDHDVPPSAASEHIAD
ncbi:MAG: Abi-alpha family protein [Nocardioides sp.]